MARMTERKTPLFDDLEMLKLLKGPAADNPRLADRANNRPRR
jgi:hypothetical protein